MKQITEINMATGEVAQRFMTSEEEAELPPVPDGPTPQERIDALERQELMPRAAREGLLRSAEILAQYVVGPQLGLTPQQALARLQQSDAGYSRVKAFDAQIAALRAQR